jgi:hypothetical protein
MALNIVSEIKFSLTDDYKLPGIAPEIANEAREAEKMIIGGILQNAKSFKQQLAYLSYPLLFLIRFARLNQHLVIRKWSLQRLDFLPSRRHPQIAVLVCRWDHLHGFRMDRLGSTTALGAVVRKPQTLCEPSMDSLVVPSATRPERTVL